MSTVTQTQFTERVVVALVLALAGSIGFTGLLSVLSFGESVRLSSAALATAYACWIVLRSGERTARLLVAVFWLIVTGALVLLYLPAVWHVLVLALMVWLVRALYCYGRPLTALLDIGLVLFAVLAGIWASGQTDSVFLSVWSTFLVLAVFVRLPSASLDAQPSATGSPGFDESASARFEQARRDAELAVEKLMRT